MEKEIDPNENNDRIGISEQPSVIEAEVKRKPQKDFDISKVFYTVLVAFACVFVFGLFFGRILFFPIEVKGSSMQPTLNTASADGNTKRDTVYLGPTKNIKRGDIVVFDSGKTIDGSPEYYIKRVIGIPGDTISFAIAGIEASGGHSFSCIYKTVLNGEVLDEPYTKETMKISFASCEEYEMNFYQQYLVDGKSITLKENEYFVMGDNRNVSLDSRYLGAIDSSTFLGKVYLRVEYGNNVLQAIIKKIF